MVETMEAMCPLREEADFLTPVPLELVCLVAFCAMRMALAASLSELIRFFLRWLASLGVDPATLPPSSVDFWRFTFSKALRNKPATLAVRAEGTPD